MAAHIAMPRATDPVRIAGCKALGADVSLPLAVGIYATGILVGALSFLPGGIGSAEAVMIDPSFRARVVQCFRHPSAACDDGLPVLCFGNSLWEEKP